MARRNFIDPFGQLLNGYREGEKDYYDNILRRLQIAEKMNDMEIKRAKSNQSLTMNDEQRARTKAGQPAADELRNVNLQIAKERLATARMNRAEKAREIEKARTADSQVPLGYGGGRPDDTDLAPNNPRIAGDVRGARQAAPAKEFEQETIDDAEAQARRDAAKARSQAKRSPRTSQADPMIDETGGAGDPLKKVLFVDEQDFNEDDGAGFNFEQEYAV